ncbi:MAG TPA: glycosyltransferase [Nitrospirota bacterium]|nr:glycosyltransferase [Nitrospirota bacterium]
MTPEVTVLMPVFNAPDTLPAAVRSVLRQSFRGFELIIVDDGSTSGLEALHSFGRLDRRVRVISLPRTGIAGALNAGLREARAALIARMDADDFCHPRRLEFQVNFMRDNPEISLLGSRVRKFPRRSLMGGMLHYERWINSVTTPDEIRRDLFVESPFAHPSVMFRRDAALSLGGYRDLGWPEDYDLWLRMAEAGMGMAKLPETLLYWREGADRLSRKDGMYSAEAFRRVKAHFLRRWRLKTARKLQLWGSGRDGKTWAKLLIETGFEVVQFIDIDKKKVGGRACGGIPVVWPADIIRGLPVVCAVGIKGAREQIRDYLLAEGFAEPEEFMFLA